MQVTVNNLCAAIAIAIIVMPATDLVAQQVSGGEGAAEETHTTAGVDTVTQPLDPKVMTELVAELESKDVTPRISAALGIARMGPKAASLAPYLIPLLGKYHASDTHGNTRTTVVNAGDPTLSSITLDGAARLALVSIGAAAIPTLLEAVHKQGGGLHNILRKIQTPEAVPVLLSGLQDENADVQAAIHVALAAQGSYAVDPLLICLKDEKKAVRVAAAFGLQGRDDRRIVRPLIEALHDPVAEVREHAAAALKHPRPRDPVAVPPLIALLNDPNARVRHNAALSLGFFKDVRATQPIINALKDPDAYARRGAAQAAGLARLVTAVDILIVLLRDKDNVVRQEAAEALGAIHDPRAVEPLIALLRQPYSGELGNARLAAARSLKYFRTEETTNVLQDAAMHDPDERVQYELKAYLPTSQPSRAKNPDGARRWQIPSRSIRE